jgi:hypothetical protein
MVHGVNMEIVIGFEDDGVRLSHGRNIRKGAWVRGIVGLVEWGGGRRRRRGICKICN